MTCRIYVGGPAWQACGRPVYGYIDDIRNGGQTPVCRQHSDEIHAPRDWQWEAAEYDRLAATLTAAGDAKGANYWRTRAAGARATGRALERHSGPDTGSVPVTP